MLQPEAGRSPSPAQAKVPIPPSDVPQTPAYRPTPPSEKGSRAVFMDFNNAPLEIMRVMDETKVKAFSSQRKRIRRLLIWLFPLGLLFIIADWLIGYNNLTFTLVGCTSWLWAAIGLRLISKRGRAPKFGSQYDLAYTLIETLRDDVSRKRTLLGWLDLTGPERESKKVRSKTSRSGRPVSYYRDEWLQFKARLYDGNVMRLSLIERRKVREGYWKRGVISGKMKFKSGSSASIHQLQLSITMAPGAYTVQSFDTLSRTVPQSRFALEEVDTTGGRLRLKAAADHSFDAWDVLHTLRYAYDHLQPVSA
jgi:hypothetical protein